jgi:ditrans,polycis-polyprenyl diphosphate synthase
MSVYIEFSYKSTFLTVLQILEVCYKIGVKVVTIYAFSIENFKRTKYEVDALMDMAKSKLSQLAQHGELLERYGAKMEFLGQREMIRPDVLEAIDKAIKMTSGNVRATLNICAPYTSRDEITTAVRNTVADYSQPIRPPLKRPFSESHIARNIRAQQLSTVSESDEAPNLSHEVSDSEPEKEMDQEAMAAYNRIDSIVEKYITDLDPDASFIAPTDTIVDCLRDTTLSNEDRKEQIDSVLGTTIASSDYADLKALYTHLSDSTASSTASTTLNLSTSDPTSNTSSQSPTNYPDPETITADTLTANTFTGLQTPPLDLLIRTSGVERLSDFMLWQCHQETEIVFLKCMWPEFDLWQFLPVLLEWQWRRRKDVNVIRRRAEMKLE